MSTHAQAVSNHRALVGRMKTHPMDRGIDNDGLLGYTMVVASHPCHGVEVFYFNVEDYSDHYMAVTGDLWVNNYSFTVQPMPA